MKRTSLLLFAIAVFGCTKEITTEATKTETSSSEQNSTVATDTYLPLTTGTFWKYNVINSSGNAQPTTQTVLAKQKSIKGKTYHAVKSVSPNNTDTLYYSQTQHDYYAYTPSGTSGLEVLFLKDNASAGTTWSTTAGTAGGKTVKCFGKIVATNTTIKVGNTTYKNVIHSTVDIREPVLFSDVTVNTQDFYVAKNIGIVKNISTNKVPSKSVITTNIVGYSIK